MSTDSVAEMRLLTSGIAVPADFYNRVLTHLQERIPQLPFGVSFTLKQLCGDDYWGQLSDGDRRRAGQCASDMVEQGLVPLTVVKTKHEYPKRYQRR